MKAVVIYFSYSGCTRATAELIAGRLGLDLLEIKSITPYPDSYRPMVDRIHGERSSNSVTGYMAPVDINLDSYSDFIIGSPVWLSELPPPVCEFLLSTDWTGRKIFPFLSMGGTIGTAEAQFRSFCRKGSLKKIIRRQYINSKCVSPAEELDIWIMGIKEDLGIF